jgi:NAD(P)-dependent dehydrogenase (short-subunit alcohol dehydrogenase family)
MRADGRGVALVTGASRRIGRALALALAEGGYDIAIHARGEDEDADALERELTAQGRRAAVVKADLADEAATATLVARAAGALGPVTLLVNNASIFHDDRLATADRDSWAAHMDVNLRAPVVLAQGFAAGLPADIPDGEAMILNIIDQRVLKPNPQFFSYSLAKSALWTATRMMAQGLAPRIRVNAIGPGPTLASIHQDQATFAAEAAAVPLGRGCDPSDICRAALYLVDARAVTGQMIAVDGGQHLAWRTPDILDT